jgi:regulatory protein
MRSIQPIEMPEPPQGGGTVSAVQVQKKDQDRCSVFLNGKFAFGLHTNIVADKGLRKGLKLSEDDCRALIQEDVYYKAMKRCLDYLAYRPRTTQEIQQRLDALKITEAIASRVKERIDELGYVDDERFAMQWAASRQRSKGFGPRRLEMELIRKGIPSALARKAAQEACPDDEIASQLRDQVAKAQHKYRHEGNDHKRTQKMINFLARRGFDIGAIRDAIQQSNG